MNVFLYCLYLLFLNFGWHLIFCFILNVLLNANNKSGEFFKKDGLENSNKFISR